MQDSQPLFIIGYPRSGTKLLRQLLNNHPDISLGGEGNFIPSIVGRIGLEANVSDPQIWPDIYQAFSQTSTFNIDAKEGKIFLEKEFIQALARQNATLPITWSNVFETILRAYNPHPTTRIFGDKSHGYIKSVSILRDIFSNLRLILIVRDPRDQALSVLKTWGRSPLRSAQGWFYMAEAANRYGLEHATDTLTVRYEDLTSDPDRELKRICKFLHVPFTSDLTLLKKPVENRRRELKVIANLHKRYRQEFSPSTVNRISEITLPYLTQYGYPTEGAKRHHTLSPMRQRWLKYQDAYASMRYHMKQKGINKGFDYYRKRHFDK